MSTVTVLIVFVVSSVLTTLTHDGEDDRLIAAQRASDDRLEQIMASFGQQLQGLTTAIKKRPAEDTAEGGAEKKGRR